jgi:hypothetical protein
MVRATVIPWNALDPRRPCYTCGAAPSGSFNDGSPRYSCSHPATTTSEICEAIAEPFDPFPRIRLTPAEVERVRRLAEKTSVRGWTGRFEPRGETRLDVDMRGFGAELAAARALGLKWSATVYSRSKARSKPPDLGEAIEVKHSKWSDGPLYVYPNEPRDRIHVLVIGRIPEYRIAGWIRAGDARRPEFWHEPPEVRAAAWAVPQEALAGLPVPADFLKELRT